MLLRIGEVVLLTDETLKGVCHLGGGGNLSKLNLLKGVALVTIIYPCSDDIPEHVIPASRLNSFTRHTSTLLPKGVHF